MVATICSFGMASFQSTHQLDLSLRVEALMQIVDEDQPGALDRVVENCEHCERDERALARVFCPNRLARLKVEQHLIPEPLVCLGSM